MLSIIPETGFQDYGRTEKKPALIDEDKIKAILFLAVRGEITVPEEKHDVDFLV
jgi:hypothetical protein